MNIEQKKIRSPFTAPKNYFGELEDIILAEIGIDKIKTLKQQGTPTGYFDDLESNIISEINIEEFKKIKTLVTPFNYFDDLASNILSEVNVEQLKQSNLSEVPNAYFEDLEEIIFSKIKLDELKLVKPEETPLGYFEELESEILAKTSLDTFGIKKENSTPKGYFEDLERSILGKTVDTKKANFKVRTNKWVYFRNAAAILLVGAFSILVYNQKQPKDEFASISSDEMIAYLSEQNLSEVELGTVIEVATVHETLDIPSDEIEKYLKDNNI